MLVVSAALVFAAPLAALWHFVATRRRTPDEKRMWRRELGGPAAFSAIAEYLRTLSSSIKRHSGSRR